MRITLQVYGGLAAGVQRASRSLDTASLAADEAAELVRLVGQAEKSPRVASSSPSAARDEITSVVTVEDESGTRVLKQGDATATREFNQLLTRLESYLG